MVIESQRNGRRHKTACVLVSGGADSGILLHEMAMSYRKVLPLYIRNGLVWEKAELYWLRRFLNAVNHSSIEPLKILELPMEDVYRLHWSLTGQTVPDHSSAETDVYLPGRNLILLSKTVVFCALNGIRAIALGHLKTNPFNDSSPAFFSSLQRVTQRGLNAPLKILTPFANRHKSEVLRLGQGLPLELTFSCLNPQGHVHCGACNKCAERIEAFREAGMSDRTIYQDPTRLRRGSSRRRRRVLA